MSLVDFIGAFLVTLAVVVMAVPDSPYNQKTIYIVGMSLLTIGMVLVV